MNDALPPPAASDDRLAAMNLEDAAAWANAISDPDALAELVAEATDVVISIETQLEYGVEGDDERSRKVGALIFWRQAVKNAKHRIHAVRAAEKVGF